MLFSEVYSTYFNAMAAILHETVQGGITQRRITEIINEKAFSESILTILPALINEEWLLLNRDMQTPIKKSPTMPLTILQKRWLKSLLTDPRIALFQLDITGLEGVEPLFTADDFVFFDRYTDGDPFTDERYIANFHTILTALKERRRLKIFYTNRKGRKISGMFVPHKLEYSSKDDKFRLVTGSGHFNHTFNLARVTQCALLDLYNEKAITPPIPHEASLTFELTNTRNALERVMLHFSDCRKETKRLDDRRYLVTLWYNLQDETEMLIRILSYGPMVKVTAPESFIHLIKERIYKQQNVLRP